MARKNGIYETLSEAGARKLETGQAYVYFLFKQKKLVYIGASANIHQRVSAHRGGSGGCKVFDTVLVLPCEKDDMPFLESALVWKLRPPLNHNMHGELKHQWYGHKGYVVDRGSRSGNSVVEKYGLGDLLESVGKGGVCPKPEGYWTAERKVAEGLTWA